MNSTLVQVTGFPLCLKSRLVFVSILVLFSALVHNDAASIQPLTVEYLGNYSGEADTIAVENILYAEPYYVLIGREERKRIIRYFEASQGELLEAFSIHLDDGQSNLSESLVMRGGLSNDNITVLLYQGDDALEYIVIDHAKTQQVTYRGTIPNIGKVREKALEGETIYMVADGDISELVVQPIAGETSRYPIPEDVRINNLEIMDGNFYYSNGRGTPFMTSGWISNSNELVLSENRWLDSPRNPYFFSIKNASKLLLITMGFSHLKMEAVLTDWSQRDQPKIIQKFNCGFGSNTIAAMFDSLIALPNPDDPENALDLYQKIGPAYEKASTISYPVWRFALGPEFLIHSNQSSVGAYDIRDPKNPRQVAVSAKTSFQPGGIAANGQYIYSKYKDENGRNILLTLDGAVPSDIKEVDRIVLPEERYTYIEAHHSLVGIFSNTDRTFYEILDNGLVGPPVVLPFLPTDDENFSLFGPIVWNRDLFIVAMSYQGHDVSRTDLWIFSRSGSVISSVPEAKIEIQKNSTRLCLSGDHLYFSKTESVRDYSEDTPPFKYYDYLFLYSLENPQQPLLLSQVEVNQGEDSLSFIDLAVHDGMLGYAGWDRSGIVDFRDPKNPVPYKPVPFPKAWYGFWYQNVLGLVNSDTIVFYQVDPEGNSVECARIPSSGGSVSGGTALSGNRLYKSRSKFGLDVFDLILDSTDVLHWADH